MPETKFKTSFIPKKPVQSVSAGGRIQRKKSSSIITLIAFVVFITTIVIAVGTFLYRIKLESDIDNQLGTLAKASESLDQQFIAEAVRLNDRIDGVQNLLDNHLSPSQIFYLLEDWTIKTLRFNNLSFSFSSDGQLALNGSGVAAGFESIIQQSDKYGESNYLRNIIFSGLQNSSEGLVSFSFEGNINKELIIYRETLGGNSGKTFNSDSAKDFIEEGNILNQEINPEGNNPQLDFAEEESDGFTLEQELIDNEQ